MSSFSELAFYALQMAQGLLTGPPSFNITYPTRTDVHGGTYVAIDHTNVKRDSSDPRVFMFVRPVNFLLNDLLTKKRLVAVDGPPGSGKSLSIWWFALEYARLHPQTRVVWIEATVGSATVLENNRIRGHRIDSFSIHSDDFVIVDQIVSQEQYLKHLYRYGDIKFDTGSLVLVTSQKLNVKDDIIQSHGGEVFTFPALKLEEYKQACRNHDFFASVMYPLGAVQPTVHRRPVAHPLIAAAGPQVVDVPPSSLLGAPATVPDYFNAAVRNDLIEQKFFYAGHSVKWMFGPFYTIEMVKRKIAKYTSKVGSLEDAFTSKLGPHTVDPCNHLFIDLEHEGRRSVVPVSQYAVWCMTESLCFDSFLRFWRFCAVNISPEHPSIDSQVLAIDVAKTLQSNTMNARVRGIVLFEGLHSIANAVVLDFAVAATVTFANESHVPGANNNFVANTWFLPESKCQGGFDFVQLLERTNAAGNATNVLRFLHVARSPSHILQLQYMTTFATNFNYGRNAESVPPLVINFEVAIITTAEHATSDKINPSTGTNIAGNLSGWNIADLQWYAFTRIHEL